MRTSTNARWKAVAFLLLSVPVSLLSLLVLWELSTGNSRAPGHALEAIPLILVTAAAWRWPRRAGTILVLVGLAAVVAYPIQEMRISSGPWHGVAFVELVIVTPPVLAGLLLRYATREGG
jgi:hypothetical protein